VDSDVTTRALTSPCGADPAGPRRLAPLQSGTLSSSAEKPVGRGARQSV